MAIAGAEKSASRVEEGRGSRAARGHLAAQYRATRSFTERLCEPLTTEDCVVQSMPDASPAKWHLAHTSWFFETFLLRSAERPYEPYSDRYGYLFNSYYDAVGERHPRARRGLLSRPTLDEIRHYRVHVDAHVTELLERASDAALEVLEPVLVLGMHHEQQHQELLLTDVKHLFGGNPLRPAYAPTSASAPSAAGPAAAVRGRRWVAFAGGLRWIGHGGPGFAFDNETPRHREYVGAFELASQPSTNGDYAAFLADGGYRRPELWLADGWAKAREDDWRAPLYWERRDGRWWSLTLSGLRPIEPEEPLCHISYYEADAFARWAGARLPTEAEWEIAAEGVPLTGNFVESGRYHPAPADPAPAGPSPAQLFGDVWEWTRSPYVAYPGFRPCAGALGEYNGKFMCNQFVLRGGSCVTPKSHVRSTYRNFFPPAARWQFTGVRLAKEG